MAYLKDIPQPRCQKCTKPARVDLMNQYNALIGSFCHKCGAAALAKQDAKERESRRSE